jgi:hypothetical protein
MIILFLLFIPILLFIICCLIISHRCSLIEDELNIIDYIAKNEKM